MGMGRPREFDAETALDQAMEVFWRHGYEGATIAQLTEAMGINPPSLYACFGNKEGLLKAALDRYTKLRGVWMDEVVAAPTAREVAERMLTGIADRQTDPANPPGCLLVQGGIACGTGSESVPFELATRRAQNEDQLRDRFVRAKAEGDLNADLRSCRARALCLGGVRRHGRDGVFGLRPRGVAAGSECRRAGGRSAVGRRKVMSARVAASLISRIA
ncbi:AcrR family transcriptional regulator [Bradyrhizobium sp. LM6.11]